MFVKGFACGAGCALLARCAWDRLEKRASKKLADRNTGAQRRKACPPDVQVSDAYPVTEAYEFVVAKKSRATNSRGFITLEDGQNIFWQMWTPQRRARAGIVLFHGIGDHCDAMLALRAQALCHLGSFAVAAFDMPGHGRSDGLIVCIESWADFTSAVKQVVRDHLIPKLKSQQANLKVFGMGDSMGGGVLFSILARERDLFAGVILVCPMLYVSEDLFPPYIVVQIFKHILCPLMPTWPIAPSKDIESRCWEDPVLVESLRSYTLHQSIVYGAIKPRLCTAYQCAFVAGDVMRTNFADHDLPTLIFHSPDDVVTDCRVSKELFDTMKGQDKQFVNPAGVWHGDMFHAGPKYYDAVQERFQLVVSWISARS
mmetsp:Transcript_47140/g.105751  ORF Transcript_47140/g.105751 Transcript_47140/m.105751 type:complete len:371 (-) Transcript_47140:57-1169(-)